MGNHETNITWQQSVISPENRMALNGHRGGVIWLTGLSGSGKTTIANELERRLFHEQIHTFTLDGDNLRHGLNSDLGFTQADRAENVRRLGEVAKLFVDAGLIVIVAAISPFRIDREKVRAMFSHGLFTEVFLACSLEVCEQRDPKGLYKRARAAELLEFTGISSPYEEPLHPELTIRTDELSIEAAADLIWEAVVTWPNTPLAR
ncbi:adenylyl-sulfate kinase [Paenibacillus sinopodophylli]|uniref:adenylyl-sulfate kinase n=1 Tax=Paenibacillus sinopodophylli TaxID=1837342 RepID=UPI00110CCDDA|nr:adenylyl-sulfate kinase [Paenibacillus sinopodophylli]